MDTIDVIHSRRAIRDFTGAAPPREEIEALIEAAIQAPNCVNRQPWAFVVAEGRDLLHDWSARAKAHFASVSPTSVLDHGYREPLAEPDFNIFYNAPALVVICATDADLMSLKDCCLAAENLMLAAHDRGLGTCWIGLSEPWLACPHGRATTGIPAEHVPVAPIILGRAKSTPPRPHRNPPDIRWVTAPGGGGPPVRKLKI